MQVGDFPARQRQILRRVKVRAALHRTNRTMVGAGRFAFPIFQAPF